LSLPRQAGTELRGSPLPLVPPEVEIRRAWRGHVTSVMSPAVGAVAEVGARSLENADAGGFDVD
jgi:two-component system sensor histidine kinase MtrB